MTLWRFVLAAATVAAVSLPTSAAAYSLNARVYYRAFEPGGAAAIDVSRHGNHGFLKGGVSRHDGAYRFHPLSHRGHQYDRIVTPPDPSLNPGSAPFSYGARVKVFPDAEWSHNEMAVLRHGDTDTPGGDYKLQLEQREDGRVVAYCAMHDGKGGFGYVRGDGGLGTVADGQWHTITCRRVDNDTVSLNIDGNVRERPTSGSLGRIVGGDPLFIGFQLQPNEIAFREQFAGFMDDIHVTVR